MSARRRAPAKWRPPLGLVTGLVLATVLALPLVGLFFFRLYENQLIRRTEAELIGQSAVVAAMAASEMAGRPTTTLGAPIPADGIDPAEPYRPIEPSLDLARGPILGRRPDALPPARPADPTDIELGERLAPILKAAQTATLAGFRILDRNGVVIAGRGEVGASLAHVDEVRDALAGRFRSVLRTRVSHHPAPPVYSISRGTAVRVFTAMPIVLDDRVAGVVYASRTPTNIVRQLYDERDKVALAGATILLATLGIGFLFSRFVTGPVHELVRRTAQIGSGDREAVRPLTHHGVRELAQLSESFLDMADRLHARSDYLRAFAAHVSHELKSPLTAIRGATELMLDAGPGSMPEGDRDHFLRNILADSERLTRLVSRLRELAQADSEPVTGETTVERAVETLRSTSPRLDIDVDGDASLILPISDENLAIILAHLADNAARHGAKRLTIRAEVGPAGPSLSVHDDGDGIVPANRERIFDEFFTTSRATGGTGMGLPIVRSLLARHHASIRLSNDHGTGSTFCILFRRYGGR